jgi:dihydrofolate synthase/folylpolyglutamate synthase
MGRYQDALDYIFSFVNYEKPIRFGYDAVTLNLGRMRELLDRLGRPQDRFRCIHIAGTKGKGSTSAMIESVLRTAGYRTGLYTSPHLHTWRERIRFDGTLMPKAALVEQLSKARPSIEAMPELTAFEIMTALAFTYFAQEGVDWAVLETGLGGRLDATNVVTPAVCAITSLSYDHVELLGHTLPEIAAEKAGIIKTGVPVVSAPQAPEALAVIEQVCSERSARLIRAGVDWTATRQSADLSGQTLTLRRTADGLTLPDLRIALLGDHQIINTTVAVALLAELCAQGVRSTDDVLRKGLTAAHWPGRFEQLNKRPVIVLDSAHNIDSALRLRATLAEFFPHTPKRRLALVFGASADKDIPGILEVLLSPDATGSYAPPARVIVSRSGHPRQADPTRLAEMARGIAPNAAVEVRDSLDGALADVLAWVKPDDLICVTGSIFVVAQARRAWATRHPEAFSPDDWVFQDETPGQNVPDDGAQSERLKIKG